MIGNGIEITPSQIAAFVNLAALVWGAAKMHSSIKLLKEFRENVRATLDDHSKDIAKIDLRVSLIEQETPGLEIDSQTFEQKDDL